MNYGNTIEGCAQSQYNQHRLGKIKVYASYSKLYKELKNGIEILVGAERFFIFKLWIKTFKMLFGSITQEPLDLLKSTEILMPCLSSLDNFL